MFSIIGAIAFGIVAVLTLLVIMGFPLGEYTMGGQHKILPEKLKYAGALALLIQIAAIIIILQVGNIIEFGIPSGAARIACFLFAAYLSINTLMNLSSKSKKERYVMTPLAFIASVCFWITAING